jgi:hypothetical protein
MASPTGAALRTITAHSSEMMSSRGTNLLRSDNTDASYNQGAQGIDTEDSETGSCQKANEDGG